ncbi:gigantic extracellular protein [Cryptosporidium ryanae]|uniref:gigantic extracellular protein n=1 Tax=Cryptosporidium ryanae TaxID=515981 RepID=UPI003519F9FA|nr:gigantic extracellular protein [Cryptosporidium ryanae]
MRKREKKRKWDHNSVTDAYKTLGLGDAMLFILILGICVGNFLAGVEAGSIEITEIGRFIETRTCESSDDCGGRSCHKGLCTGLSGNDYIKYVCYLGEDCTLASVPGSFDEEFQKRYEVKAIPFEFECGSLRNVYKKRLIMPAVSDIRNYKDAEAGGGDVANSEGSRWLECDVSSNKECAIAIPKEALRLGRYRLCGSPFSKEEYDGAKFEELVVPIGVLEVFGLKGERSNAGKGPGEERGGSLGRESYINKDILARNKSVRMCTANVPCSISGIRGFGISENAKIMEIYKTSLENRPTTIGELRCGTELKEGERVYVHRCTPYNGGTECFFTSVSTEPQITLLCGCMTGGDKKCESPKDFDVYISTVVYHRGISQSPDDESAGTSVRNGTVWIPSSVGIGDKGALAPRSLQMDPCASCVNGYGLCYGMPKTCYGGFGNNPYDPPLILCVDGYDCRIKGKIIGEQITSRYKVAASPTIGCGVRILSSDESMFHSHNQWSCEGGNPFDCELHFGVGRRYNRSETDLNTMLLCGCPDFASAGMPCDEPAEFYFPVAQIKVVECTDNTHCMHNALASCNADTNQCQGVLPSVAQIGLGTMRCLSRQSCTIANIGQFIGGEMYRVVQTAPYVKCGASVALDPDYYQKVQTQMEATGPGGMGLPCIVQGGDGGAPGSSNCAINLGTNAILGINRLCGCSGVDRDGNGIPCDSPEDFDTDLGLLDVGECNTDKDCKAGQVCTEHKCLNDQLLPYPSYFVPLNHSTLVPPVKELVIGFNENIGFPKEWHPRRLVITSSVYYRSKPLEIPILAQKEGRTGAGGGGGSHHGSLADERSAPGGSSRTGSAESGRWAWWNKSKSAHSQGGVSQVPVSYSSEIRGRRLIISFDSRTPLPEDEYVIGLEPGAITDLQGNPNDAVPIWTFTISRNVSCPYMYVTGFGTNNGNINGLYTPWKSPMNGKAVWNGGERKQFYVYYSRQDDGEQHHADGSGGAGGAWVIDRDLDGGDIIAYAETSLPDPHNHIPPDGKTTAWKKWSFLNSENDPEWLEHRDISIMCKSYPEKTPPSLIGIQPSLGSTSVPKNNTEIKLTFNRPMNYGHWAWFNITGRNTGHLIHIPTDYEALYRGLYVISNQTSEVILRPYEPLMEGETYDITVELGALTDLSYQPWGNVGPNQLFFTTDGRVCPELDLSLLYDASEIGRIHVVYTNNPVENSDAAPDSSSEQTTNSEPSAGKRRGVLAFQAGTNAILRCADGYSTAPAASPNSQGSFGCLSGKWKLLEEIRCFQRCKPYPISSVSSENYLIQEYGLGSGAAADDYRAPSEAAESVGDKTYAHGSRLKVTCAGTEGSEIVTCNDGTWSALKLICGTSCPPYALPSDSHSFKSDKDLEKHTPDSEITIVCSRNSDRVIEASNGEVYLDSESREFTLTCIHGHWQPKQGPDSREGESKCLKRCSPIPRYRTNSEKGSAADAGESPYYIEYSSSDLEGSFRHGTLGRVRCSENWSTTGEADVSELMLACYDGSWSVVDSKFEPKGLFSYASMMEEHSFRCERRCPELEIFKNKAYVIDDATPEGKRGVSGSRVRIQCDRDRGTTQMGTRKSDEIQCANGVWGVPKTVCLSNCDSPEVALGSAYEVYDQLASRKRNGLYQHGSRISISCSDQGTLMQGSDLSQTATCTNGEWVFDNALICASKCPVLRLPARYRIASQSLLESPADTGDLRYVTCSSSSGGLEAEEVLECKNGEWYPPKPRLECLSDCILDSPKSGPHHSPRLTSSFAAPAHSLLPYMRENYEILSTGSENGNTIRHGDWTTVRCKQGYVRKTGPVKDKLLCKNGVFQTPTLICQRPSCFDGIQNQGELGVDCGGSCQKKCPDTCFDGIINGDETSVDCGGACGTENCPKCDDGIKNGDETGVDCGGSQCPACQSCHGFPVDIVPENAVLSVDGGFTYIEDLEKESFLIENMATASGSEIHIRCVPGWEKGDTLESKLLVLSCSDGKWLLPDPSERDLMRCSPPTCDDGIQNGDESGIDCGGSCENHCRSCFDGVKNGDETGVDCGGTDCRPCNPCDNKLIQKIPSLGAHLLDYEGNTSRDYGAGRDSGSGYRTGGADAGPFPKEVLTGHGSFGHNSKLRVGCLGSEKVVTLTCSDGKWVNVELVGALPCAGERTGGSEHGHDSGEDGYLGLAERNGQGERGVENGGEDYEEVISVPFSSISYCSGNSGLCCELVRTFADTWNGECGVMYRQGRDTMIKTFCKGRCMGRLREILGLYESSKSAMLNGTRIECRSAESISLIIKNHLCQSDDHGGGDPCSYSFHETLLTLNDPLLLLDQSKTFKLVCDKESCHRRNLRLIQALSRFTRLSKPGMSGKKDDLSSDDTDYENSFVRRESHNQDKRHHDSGNPSGSARNGASAFDDYWRQILLIQGERALDLLCMSAKSPNNSKEKHSCVTTTSRIIMPTLARSSSIEWLSSMALEGRQQGNGKHSASESGVLRDSISGKCVRNLPEDVCFFQSMRVYGQLLYQVGREIRSKEMVRTGYLYRSIGRYYCQETVEGRICGELLFKNVFSESGTDWWSSLYESSFGGITIKDTCNPYHLNFSCTPHCKKKLVDQLNGKGCCYAAQLEIQRGILEIEKREEEEEEEEGRGEKASEDGKREFGGGLSAIREKLGVGAGGRGGYDDYYSYGYPFNNARGLLYSKINTERSIDYLEQRCGFSMDRVCSSGVKTDNILLEFRYKNFNYFEMANTLQEEYLRESLRETVSGFLSLPISDIPRMRSWPGSYVIEMLIDAGLSTRSVLGILEENGKQLETELSKYDEMDDEYGLRVKKVTQSYSRSLSIKEPPSVPYVGTFDMDTLSNQLDYPTCPRPSLELFGIDASDNSGNVYENGYEITGDTSLKQGSYRNVMCKDSYSPVSSPKSAASQSYICDNGRWRRIQNESKMECKKSCMPFSHNEIGSRYFRYNRYMVGRYEKPGEFEFGFEANSRVANEEDADHRDRMSAYFNENIFGNNYIPEIEVEVQGGGVSPYIINRDGNNEFQSAYGNGVISQYLISGVGTDHGSTRSITCSHGHISDNPNTESETFKCDNGNWVSNLNEEDRFNCVKGTDSKLRYCKVSFISSIIGTEKYQVSELFDFSKQGINDNGDGNGKGKSENDLKLFKIACSRGYENEKEPALLACINGNYYNIKGDTKTLSKNTDSKFMYRFVTKTLYSKNPRNSSDFNNLTPVIPAVSFSNGIHSNGQNTVSIHKILNCTPMKVMKLSESKGLSGPVLYSILFAPLIIGMLLLATIFWFRKYKWKKKLVNRENSDTSANKEIALAILDVGNKKTNISDIENANNCGSNISFNSSINSNSKINYSNNLYSIKKEKASKKL